MRNPDLSEILWASQHGLDILPHRGERDEFGTLCRRILGDHVKKQSVDVHQRARGDPGSGRPLPPSRGRRKSSAKAPFVCAGSPSSNSDRRHCDASMVAAGSTRSASAQVGLRKGEPRARRSIGNGAPKGQSLGTAPPLPGVASKAAGRGPRGLYEHHHLRKPHFSDRRRAGAGSQGCGAW